MEVQILFLGETDFMLTKKAAKKRL